MFVPAKVENRPPELSVPIAPSAALHLSSGTP